jgi:hypothetical protein
MGELTVVPAPGQIAAFRNPAVPQKGLPTGQGLTQAAVIQSGEIQYLNQSQAGTWSLAPLSSAQAYPAQEVVASFAPLTNPSITSAGLIWSSGSGLMASHLTSADEWAQPIGPLGSVPNLTSLQVAYTPAGNPVVYGVDSSSNLWMYAWSSADESWSASEYSNSAMGWGGAPVGLSVVFVSETNWTAFGNASAANALVSVSGALGSSDLIVTNFGVPTAGSFRNIVGGAVSPSSAAANQSTPCVFYIDGGRNLMMWPASLGGDAVIPVPDVDALPGGVGNMPPATTVSNTPGPNAFASLGSGGTATTLYQADSANNVYAIRQLAWVFDNQLPFFSPPTYIIGGTLNEVAATGVVPIARPANVPAVFVVNIFGWVWECELNGQPGTWNGTSQTGQWTASQINV